MSINLSIRNYQIVIAGLDCTRALVSFQGSDSKLDEGGLVTFTGTIVLGRPDGFESLDDRRNTRWSRGNPILVKIADKSATLRNSPRCSHLHILSASFDLKTRKLTLQVGDIFALLNFKEGKGDKSGICLGTSVSKSEVVSRLLVAAGAPSLSGFIPGVLQSPTPRLLEGSYIGQAGAIAASSGCFLYVHEGVPTVGTLGTGGQPRVSIDLMTSAVEYQRLGGEQAPTRITVRANAKIVRENEDETETLTEEYGPALAVGRNSTTEILLRRIRTADRFSRENKIRTIVTTTEQAAGLIDPTNPSFKGSVALMNAEYRIEQYFYETNSPVKDGESKCEKGEKGRLLKQTIEIYRPVAIAFKAIFETYPKDVLPGTKKPSFPIALEYSFRDSYQLVLVERQVTTYQYEFTSKSAKMPAMNGGNAPEEDPEETKLEELEELGIGPKIVTLIEKSIGTVLPEQWAYDPSAKHQLLRSFGRVVPVERQTNYWEELKFNEWEKREVNEKGFVLAYPDLKDELDQQLKKESLAYDPILMLALVPAQDGVKVTRSNAGQAQPPAPDTYNPAFSVQDAVVKGKATLPVDTAFQYRQRERELSFEYLAPQGTTPREAIFNAREQANRLAQLWGQILWGRYKGVSCISDLADGWFGYRPLDRVNVTEPDGVAAYWADGFSIAMSEAKCAIGFDGMLLGWASVQHPTLIAPIYQQRFEDDCAIAFGLVDRSRSYSLNPIESSDQCAIAFAIRPEFDDLSKIAIAFGLKDRTNYLRDLIAVGWTMTDTGSVPWEELAQEQWQEMTQQQWGNLT
jgi:hypothetical protein